jgi:hypothetical protein
MRRGWRGWSPSRERYRQLLFNPNVPGFALTVLSRRESASLHISVGAGLAAISLSSDRLQLVLRSNKSVMCTVILSYNFRRCP